VPVGTVADAVLRALREEVWTSLAALARRRAERSQMPPAEAMLKGRDWLGSQLGIDAPFNRHHLTLEQCRRAKTILAQFIHRIKAHD
jgi:hypothetical protein